jgi:hypothetical protein
MKAACYTVGEGVRWRDRAYIVVDTCSVRIFTDDPPNDEGLVLRSQDGVIVHVDPRLDTVDHLLARDHI